MIPERPISVPQDAIEASVALRNRLNAREAGKYTTGVGLKQTGGVFTDQISLFVYVPLKRPPEDVTEGELVPSEFGGYVTDVVEVQPTLIEDSARYDPLHGGIEISRERIIDDGIFAPPTGTLGAIVTSRVDGAAQLLTCAHVVQRTDLNVYQPGQVSTSPTTDIVGTILALRSEFNPLFLDCAVIDLNGSRSWKATIEDIGPVQGALTDVPPLGEVVKKRGKRTLLTNGFVVRLISSAFVPAIDEFEMSGAVPSVTLFAGGGDSGSVVLNSSNQVIGLLFAIPNEDLGPKLSSGGIAQPIYNVQEALQIDVAS
ncbi:trypsin-like peptidase domain-containing protein [Streptomyces sp. NPDC020719]|uniref:trypsin-like peptidase domain-containing protein n=1 Tax=unclassified Streptomyces TaxID=2593676 RepID=UPI0033F4E938